MNTIVGRIGSIVRTLFSHAVVWWGIFFWGPLCIVMTLFFPKRAFNFFGAIWAWCILKASGIRLEVSGTEHLSPSRCQVVVANHSSNFDIYCILWALRTFYFRFVAKKELKYVPVLGWALWLSGTPLLDRGSSPKAQATMRKLMERMRRTAMMALVFPEGTRNKNDGLLPFKKGAFVLAIDLNAPVVPLIIEGAREIQPRHGFTIHPGTLRLTFLPPIPTDGQNRKDRNAMTLHVQALFEEALHCKAASPKAEGEIQP